MPLILCQTKVVQNSHHFRCLTVEFLWNYQQHKVGISCQHFFHRVLFLCDFFNHENKLWHFFLWKNSIFPTEMCRNLWLSVTLHLNGWSLEHLISFPDFLRLFKCKSKYRWSQLIQTRLVRSFVISEVSIFRWNFPYNTSWMSDSSNFFYHFNFIILTVSAKVVLSDSGFKCLRQ